MDPYSADGPSEHHSGSDPDDAVPGILPRLAGVGLILSGVFVAGSGAQLLFFFTLYELWIQVVAGLMVLLGTVSLPLGGAVFQCRDWATGLGLPLAASTALMMTLWLVYALYVGLFSPMMVLAWLLSGLATLLMAAALPSAMKTSRARRDLYR